MTLSLRRGRVRRGLATLTAVGAIVGLTACGGDEQPVAVAPSDDRSRAIATTTPTSARTLASTSNPTTASTPPVTWPLTGEPVDGHLPDFPVMAVKIDNSQASRPQIGLSAADVVTEELVEGGITRLNVFFYSDVPELVGPVRSMRTSDIGIVKPADAVLVASGGAFKTRGFVNGANITTFTEEAPGFQRASDRAAPYNLMMRLPDLVGTLAAVDPPSPYLPFGATDMAGGRPAIEFDVVFSSGHTTSFRYEQSIGYTRPGTLAGEGDDFAADTVLVLRVRQGDAGYLDPAGNPVPETIYAGGGAMMLFHDGAVIEGSWSKGEPRSPLELTTRSGDPIVVAPGRTWIELAPTSADGGSVKIG